jgi:AraC-like DNA-binding protein
VSRGFSFLEIFRRLPAEQVFAFVNDFKNRAAALVRLSGLAERSFKRRFQSATGMPPLEYVHALRIEEAKQMLEAGEEPIEGASGASLHRAPRLDPIGESIAHEVGYEDAAFFSRLFKRKVNLSPAQYRKRFGALRQSLVNPAAAR